MKYSKQFLLENKNKCLTCETRYEDESFMKNSVRCKNCHNEGMKNYMAKNTKYKTYNYVKVEKRKPRKRDYCRIKIEDLRDILNEYISEDDHKEEIINKLITV